MFLRLSLIILLYEFSEFNVFTQNIALSGGVEFDHLIFWLEIYYFCEVNGFSFDWHLFHG